MTDLHLLLVNEAPVGIVALSVAGTILFWNKRAETIFGHSQEEAVGQSLHTLIFPADQGQTPNAIAHALEKGTSVYECISTTGEGVELPVEVHLSAQMHEQQVIILGTIRVLPLQKQQDSAQETIEFLANMSHELRTPLNSIIGFTEFLTEDQSGSLNTKQKEYLTDVLASGKQLLNLINALLDLAKIDTGKISVFPEDFDIRTVVQQVLSIFEPMTTKNNVQIETDISEDCGVVTLDLHKFKQVLFNILSEAIKSTGKGGRIETVIRISTTENLEIVITANRSQPPDEEVEGLNLLLTKKILELQQGSLTIEDASDWRTSFIVRLPARHTMGRPI